MLDSLMMLVGCTVAASLLLAPYNNAKLTDFCDFCIEQPMLITYLHDGVPKTSCDNARTYVGALWRPLFCWDKTSCDNARQPHDGCMMLVGLYPKKW